MTRRSGNAACAVLWICGAGAGCEEAIEPPDDLAAIPAVDAGIAVDAADAAAAAVPPDAWTCSFAQAAPLDFGGPARQARAPKPGAELVHVSKDERWLLYRTDATAEGTWRNHGKLWLQELPDGVAKQLAADAALGGVFGDTVIFWDACSFVWGCSGSLNVFTPGMSHPAQVNPAPGTDRTLEMFGLTPGKLGSAKAETLVYMTQDVPLLLRAANCTDQRCAAMPLDVQGMQLYNHAISPNGTYVAYSLKPYGLLPRDPVGWLLTTETMSKAPLPQPYIDAADFSPDGSLVALALSGPSDQDARTVSVIRLADGTSRPWIIPPATRYRELVFQDADTLWVHAERDQDEILFRTTAQGATDEVHHVAGSGAMRIVNDGPQKGRIAMRAVETEPMKSVFFIRLDQRPACQRLVYQTRFGNLLREDQGPLPVSDDGAAVLFGSTLYQAANGAELATFDNDKPRFIPRSNRLLLVSDPSLMGWYPIRVSIWDGQRAVLVDENAARGNLAWATGPGRLFYTELSKAAPSATIKSFDLP